MVKKIILSLILLMAITVGTLFAINGKNNYDASKYSATATNGLHKGSILSFTLPDQFDKAGTLTSETKKVIFVFAKATGHTVREFLKKQDKSYLPSRHTLFVADVSGMPTIIRNTFALPDFRKSPYSVLLIYDKAIAKSYKNNKDADKITLVTLQNKTITKIETFTSEEELKKAL
ncbi:FAD/FMN-containing dehydrogenases [hydrothermal vent metagenome]|uniref:FAD/FMN-containing dehydrogenases n=1 Tax=hydrothermal vent metagenome TaxID=652676 RepID=A0A1W1BNG1_9ZZZZ